MATDALLPTTLVEEALSDVYVTAVASAAGYTVARKNFDVDGVDLTIDAGGTFRPRLDVQLKATINLAGAGDTLNYFCPKRNHDLLRLPTQTPRILVVLHLPTDQVDWIQITPKQLVLRHAAYWHSVRGDNETDNASGCTVYIPKANRLDVAALQALMEKSRSGAI
jgi:hypothetical protein